MIITYLTDPIRLDWIRNSLLDSSHSDNVHLLFVVFHVSFLFFLSSLFSVMSFLIRMRSGTRLHSILFGFSISKFTWRSSMATGIQFNNTLLWFGWGNCCCSPQFGWSIYQYWESIVCKVSADFCIIYFSSLLLFFYFNRSIHLIRLRCVGWANFCC